MRRAVEDGTASKRESLPRLAKRLLSTPSKADTNSQEDSNDPDFDGREEEKRGKVDSDVLEEPSPVNKTSGDTQ